MVGLLNFASRGRHCNTYVLRCAFRYCADNCKVRGFVQRKDYSIFDNESAHQDLFQFVSTRLVQFQKETALTDSENGCKLSYTSVLARSKKFGSFLVKQGLNKGQICAIISKNRLDYFSAFLGIIGAGCSVTTVNPDYTFQEITQQLMSCKTPLVVCDATNINNVRSACIETGVQHVVTLDDCTSFGSDAIPWRDIMNDDGSSFVVRPSINTKNTVAYIPFSSGTTGKAKGVMLTHKNIVSNILQMEKMFEDMPRGICLSVLPFYHIYGILVTLCYFLCQGKHVVISKSFEPEAFLSAIENYKIGTLFAVPPMLLFLLNHPLVDNYDLSSLTEITTGGATVSPQVIERTYNKFPNVKVVRQGYGMSELGAAMLQTVHHYKQGSVGQPLSNIEVKVANLETGAIQGPNQLGEIVVRGPNVMKGYLNSSEEMLGCVTENGWMKTGDVGYYDNDFHFFIVDRIKELIKYKGFQVAPAELEEILLIHPKVLDVAVIGIPDERAGEIPKAYVVSQGGVTEEELQTFVNQRTSESKMLRGGVEFVLSIPKSPSGKILRRVLQAEVRKSL